MQHVWVDVFTGIAWILSIAWVWQALVVFLGMRRLVDLSETDVTSLDNAVSENGYHLTVIVPACNEEQQIRATLDSLISATGVRLQIVVVDDRSTDGTGEILDRFAAECRCSGSQHSVDVLHIDTLPDGWLGKTYAMQRASELAQAPWILFTDADMVFAPEALERALSCALRMRSDHFVLLPTLICNSILESAMTSSIHALSQWITHHWKVSEPDAKDFIGVGGFNMIRTEVFRSLGGFAPIRMEVIEDMSLGWMVKRAGYRSTFVVGPGLVKIRWIEGAFGVTRNIEKNGFSLFRYRAWLCMLACVGLLVDIVVPLGAIAMGGWALAAGLTTHLALGFIFYANRKLNRLNPIAVVLFAPCAAIICFGFARSMVLTLKNKGIRWRGTQYPLSDLRQNAASWK